MKPYRILSLDGGGTWALIQVIALQAIYGQGARGHQILNEFDLVAGNSGGSITMGGLLTNKPLDEVLAMFLDQANRTQVFAHLEPFTLDPGSKPFKTMWNRLLHRFAGVGAKYKTEAKLDGLRRLLGEDYADQSLFQHHQELSRLYGRSPHFLICGFDYDRKRAKFFRSNLWSLSGSVQTVAPGDGIRQHDVRLPASTGEATLAQAIHASSNAPVSFFMSPAEIKSASGARLERYWDGAIAGYNNPVLAAVTEALANERYHPNSGIEVLSLGTGTVSLPDREGEVSREQKALTRGRRESTVHGDLKQLAMSILDDPPDSATFTAHVVLRQPIPDPFSTPPIRPPVSGSVIRMSPVVRPVRDPADGGWRPPGDFTIPEFLTLRELDLDAVAEPEVLLLAKLGRQWVEDRIANQPIRENRNFECQIGHAKFSEARDAWIALVRRAPREGAAA